MGPAGPGLEISVRANLSSIDTIASEYEMSIDAFQKVGYNAVMSHKRLPRDIVAITSRLNLYISGLQILYGRRSVPIH